MSPSRDHQGIVLDKFNGLYDRGDKDTVPRDHFSDCNNIGYVSQSTFLTRPGIAISQNVLAPLANIKRIYNYHTQTTDTLIVLTYDPITGYGSIHHIVDKNTIYGPLLTIKGMTDFAFVPYAGRAYISPFSRSTPLLSSPSIASSASLAGGGGVNVGVHQYAYSFVNPAGETIVSLLTPITTTAAIADPVIAPSISDQGINAFGANALIAGATYKWLITYQLAPGAETNIGPASLGFVAPANTHLIGLNDDLIEVGLPAGAKINVYRTLANGSVFYLEQTGSFSTINIAGTNYFAVGQVSDAAIVANQLAPTSNTTNLQKVNLSNISIGSGTTSARNIYRTKANLSQLQLVSTISNNASTTFVDTIADSALGANAPTTNTAAVGTNIIEIGLAGEFLYVYAGDGTPARKAAGSGLSGSMTVANGAAGHTDPGRHIFGIVSQTVSGYNAPPTILTSFVTAAGSSVSFGNIPTSGDPNVVKRLLVSTIVLPTFNGNLSGYQFFFVPNAVINNNTDTFLNNISFYDADLLSDASSLLNNYTSIPAGASLSLYHNRLCLAATATDISLMLVSKAGEPEAISQISGLIVVPLDGNPITNAQEMRDVLYVFKRAKTVAYADNGGDPSGWPLIPIDSALGTCVHGIATVLDSGSASVDYLIICTYQGISQFNGRYVTPELSWKIENLWKQLDRNSFGNIQIINAPIQKEIYTILPNKELLVGNYGNGFDWKNIRWSPWTFRMGVNTVAIHNIDEIVLGADIN